MDILIQPVPTYRLVPQDVRAISVRDGAITIQTISGDVDVDVLTVNVSVIPSLLFLKKLTIQTPTMAFHLEGVTSREVDLLQLVVDASRKRKRLVQEFRQSLLGNRETVHRILAVWDKLAAKDVYLTGRDIHPFRHFADSALSAVRNLGLADETLIDLLGLPDDYSFALRRLLRILADTSSVLEKRNTAYAARERHAFRNFFDSVENYPLTDQQRDAIIHDDDSGLVIAGAGTGKTSTIVGKVGYLLRKRLAKPEEILLLAFTRKAADEMAERIRAKLGVDLSVLTFHSLGLEIIAAANDRKPALCAEARDPAVMAQTLQGLIERSLVDDDDFRRDFLTFQSRLRQPYRPRWEFKSEAAYRDYLLDVEPRALTGRLLKSYEECEIANWLFINGIPFEYEPVFREDTADKDYRQYTPDFFLPNHNLYIEHWGIDRNGRTAPFVEEGPYRAKMTWAREVHAKHGTTLIETYSWQKQNGILVSALEAALREHGVEPHPICADTVLTLLNEVGCINPFLNLCSTFLHLFKSATAATGDSAGIALTQLFHRARLRDDAERTQVFVRLFATLFAGYQDMLFSRGEIDFEDMIAKACGHVRDGRYRSSFRYILVDEFQDISDGRASLIQELRMQADGAKLFCVGDDWQSIYRFAGSDISLMTAFDRHFGPARKTALGRTFRFHNKIADFSTRFVQRNPGQIRKQLTTQTTSEQPGVVVCLGGVNDPPLTSILTEITASEEIIDTANQRLASVFLLSRYKHVDPIPLRALRQSFPRLNIQAMTVHASKGLEADYVVVRGLGSGKYGFPSQIADDPILTLVLAESEAFPFAEERRLFYVALTRAKKQVYLLTDAAQPSEFVREILEDEGFEKIVRDSGTGTTPSRLCPQCRRGEVTRREGKFGNFYGCSNYPVCDYRGIICRRCSRGWMMVTQDDTSVCRCGSYGFVSRVCPQCRKGVLVERRSGEKRLPFWGCSRYGRAVEGCVYTEPFRPTGGDTGNSRSARRG